jgi:hypothetical protein
MKCLNKIFSILLTTALFTMSCQEEKYELEAPLDKADIKFEVTQDLATDPGGNTVIMTNNTPGTISMWNYGTGKSTRVQDTVHFAFKGEYVIKFSALSNGQVVEMDPVTVTVTEDNLNYVNDPLWTALSGGVGNEKTWILDIDANHFAGPMFFYGTDNGWLGGCLKDGGDCWNWSPDYAGNTWLMPDGDYGTMTFSLKGGPYVTSNHLMIPSRGTESGTYYLDKDAKTLAMTDATPLHDKGRDECVSAWGSIRLFALTENYMQLGVLRTSCDGPCYLVYNFVPKK